MVVSCAMKQGHNNQLLPISRTEMKQRGWVQADVILVTADAYIDHPAFGVAMIGRYLSNLGYKVAILAQPRWDCDDDFKAIGPPRLFWGISSGAIDSKINDYASMGNKRKKDLYSPGGKIGLRPARPLLAYTAKARQAFKGIPIILGGLEASIRRVTHYDFIEDKMKRSVMCDAKADGIVYGMAEKAITEIADGLNSGKSIYELTDIAGTAWRVNKNTTIPENVVRIASLEEQSQTPIKVMQAYLDYQKQANPAGKTVIQDQSPGDIILNPPAKPLSTKEMDALYTLPFTRKWHKKYDAAGGVPALEPVLFSITTHRGCFGGCSFCSIHLHQGKQIVSRSIDNLITEAESFKKDKRFKGTISDVGGPTANMYGMKCELSNSCSRPSCIGANVCKHFKNDTTALMKMNRAFVKWKHTATKKMNVYVASGIRFDMAVKSKEYIDLLAMEFVGGHLKVAPEHFCDNVLALMNKSSFADFEKFEEIFESANKKSGKEQYLVPYFISSHPGCTTKDALRLAEYLVSRAWYLRQVQDYIPIPMTESAAMYVSGVDNKFKKIYVARGRKEKRLQAALMQFHNPKNKRTINEFLAGKGKQKLMKQIELAQNKFRNKF